MDRVFAVEIDDGYKDVVGTIFEDTINNRAYCGEGDFDTRTFIQRTLDAGYTGPWGVEIISAEHRSLPVAEGLKRAYETAINCFPGVTRAERPAPSAPQNPQDRPAARHAITHIRKATPMSNDKRLRLALFGSGPHRAGTRPQHRGPPGHRPRSDR